MSPDRVLLLIGPARYWTTRMSDRYGTDYRRQPVIARARCRSAAFPARPGSVHWRRGPRLRRRAEAAYDDSDPDDGYDDEEYYEDEEDDSYGYYDDYEDTAPARQPMFYVFVALAALVGGIVVFLLFSLVKSGDGGDAGGGGDTKFAVAIDSPVKDKRIEIGKPEEVIVQASATEPISRFELFVGDKLTDTVNVTETPADNRYRAVMKFTLTARGNYELMVKVTASSGATKESSKVRVIAFEPVGERPQTIKGKVVADTTLRAGPGDNYPESGILKAGTKSPSGKDKATDWLLVDSAQGQRWAKRTAIDPSIPRPRPLRDVTPPAPTQEPTSTIPPPSPSAAQPHGEPERPDFVPDAVLIEGAAPRHGPEYQHERLQRPVGHRRQRGRRCSEIAIDAKPPGNGGSANVEFGSPRPSPRRARRQSSASLRTPSKRREDNNGATFVLLPPEESPEIVIPDSDGPAWLSITIQNNGGDMAVTA
jgi:hypothetical protein